MSGTVPRWTWDHDPVAVRALLDAGGVLAIPSESSYGLAVEPTSALGVEAVYRLKQREAGKPLLVVAASRAQFEALGVAAPEVAWRHLDAVWPAALTAVLPLRVGADGNNLPACAGSASLAVRIPDHPRLCAWLATIGPVTATSANLSGEPPVLTVDGAVELLGRLDGVPCAVIQPGPDGEASHDLPGGPPSTLVAWAGSDWTGSDRTGSDWTGSDRTGSNEAPAWRLLRAGRHDLTNSDFQHFMVPSLR